MCDDDNSKRIQRILDNLDIVFINCKFIFTEFEDVPNLKKRRGTLKDILKAAEDAFDELTGSTEDRYDKCTFSPGFEEQIRKQMASYETETMKFRFVRCKFVKRGSTFLENVVRKMRKIFGITFVLNYVTHAVEIEGSKFKIKDIPTIKNIVIERIQDD